MHTRDTIFLLGIAVIALVALLALGAWLWRRRREHRRIWGDNRRR